MDLDTYHIRTKYKFSSSTFKIVRGPDPLPDLPFPPTNGLVSNKPQEMGRRNF